MYPLFDEEAVLVSVCILYPICSLHFIPTGSVVHGWSRKDPDNIPEVVWVPLWGEVLSKQNLEV